MALTHCRKASRFAACRGSSVQCGKSGPVRIAGAYITAFRSSLRRKSGSAPMTRRAARSSNQQELALEPFTLVRKPLKQSCDRHPQRLGSDQYRCPDCNLVWDVDEERPACILNRGKDTPHG